jgi:acetyltransferase
MSDTVKGPKVGLAHELVPGHRTSLDAIFAPQSVAVIGATEKPKSVGRTILANLLGSNFGGRVFPVNPKRPSVLGEKAYATVADVPEPIDLAVVVTPAATVPDVIGECAAVGVGAAIVISAGFKEVGPAGAELEARVLERARAGRVRLLGPNCLGVMRPQRGLNATFASTMALPGSVGFLSQSGALCTAILDWSLRERVGFSAFVSIGSMLDLGWGELIDYLGDDPRTESIVIYMESIGDARSFLSAAREVALSKPIIVIKAGRTDAAAKAAMSHTGALAGSDDVIDAAFRRCGALRVDSISDVFAMAEVLGKQPRPQGPRLAIITNAGGPGVLATDALIRDKGALAELSPELIHSLNGVLPAAWSHGNPIDVLGDAGPDRYAQVLSLAAQDPDSDGLLVMLTPQAMTEPTQTAEALRPFAKIPGKPVLASWMGGADVAAGDAILSRAGFATFPYPDTAARVFCAMWRLAYNLQGLYETPSVTDGTPVSADVAEAIGAAVRGAGRTILTEFESKQLLAAYGIPTVPTRVAKDEREAVAAAVEIGFPVVLKLHSQTLTHKTDVGGVQLHLASDDAVRRTFGAIQASVRQRAGSDHFLGVTVQPMIARQGYELIVGGSLDPQFGPVLMFGAGGELVEVFKDRALALPPLNTTLARRLMEQTQIYQALRGVRGRKPVDLAALEQLLVLFSRLVVEQPWIKEIDINPLRAAPEGLLALDARVIAHEPTLAPSQFPRPAIRPYPRQYVSPWVAKDQTPLLIRPIRPEDEPLLIQFHQALSEETVAMRYFHAIHLRQRVAHNRLTRICFIDYDREMALVADREDSSTGAHDIVGVGRLTKLHGFNEAEFALLVHDSFQRRGLGTELLRRLIGVARDERLARISAEILPENRAMQKLCRNLGFELSQELGDVVVRASVALRGPN